MERGAIWMRWSGAKLMKRRAKASYEQMKERTEARGDSIEGSDLIAMDVRRTAGCSGNNKNSMLDGLRTVLVVLAAQHPDVGYMQGMNYVGGSLLLVTEGREEEAYWLIQTLCTKYYLRYYQIGSTGLQVDAIVLERLVSKYAADVGRKMSMLSVDFSILAFGWLACLFSQCLTQQVLCQLWDRVMICAAQFQNKRGKENAKSGAQSMPCTVLLWFALVVVKVAEEKLLQAIELDTFTHALKNEMKNAPNLQYFLDHPRVLELGFETPETLHPEITMLRFHCEHEMERKKQLNYEQNSKQCDSPKKIICRTCRVPLQPQDVFGHSKSCFVRPCKDSPQIRRRHSEGAAAVGACVFTT
jgi:hypothetical protein